jgi:hypothetical protein
LTYEAKNRFQAHVFQAFAFKCNLCRYTTGTPAGDRDQSVSLLKKSDVSTPRPTLPVNNTFLTHLKELAAARNPAGESGGEFEDDAPTSSLELSLLNALGGLTVGGCTS